MIREFNATDRKKSLIDQSEKIEEIEQNLADGEYTGEIRRDMALLKETLCYKFVIEYYTFHEQLVKNLIYKLLNHGGNDDVVDKFIMHKIPAERFVPQVQYNLINKNLKFASDVNVFFINLSSSIVKSHDILINNRHKLAHAGYDAVVIENLDHKELAKFAELNLELVKFAINSDENDRKKYNIMYENLYDKCEKFKNSKSDQHKIDLADKIIEIVRKMREHDCNNERDMITKIVSNNELVNQLLSTEFENIEVNTEKLTRVEEFVKAVTF